MTAVRLTHVGGPTVLIEVDGWRLLTDPTFDPPGRRYRFGWGTSSRKLAGPTIDAGDIGPIDAVLLTHDHHADNLDDTGRTVLAGAGTVLTTISGARRLGSGARGLDAWDTTELRDGDRPTIDVTATPCRHGPPGTHRIVGDVIGFALRWDGQRHGQLWITGDTVRYDGVGGVTSRLDIGTAIVHLGGVRFPISGPLRYTMTARDATRLFADAAVHTIVPVHYEGWSHFAEPASDAHRTLAAEPSLGDAVRWLPLGEPTELEV